MFVLGGGHGSVKLTKDSLKVCSTFLPKDMTKTCGAQQKQQSNGRSISTEQFENNLAKKACGDMVSLCSPGWEPSAACGSKRKPGAGWKQKATV